MPACAVASRTPAMAGRCGVVLGASGEMFEGILVIPRLGRCSRVPESIIPASVVSFEYWDYGFRHSLTRPQWRFFALPARANYFFAGAAGLSAEGLAWPAGLSRRSIVADLRRLSTSSACARRAT